jgi:hypothetical protein
MILQLMAYTMVVSLLVGLAALMLERAVTAPAWPRRWLWAIGMTLSLGGSAGMMLSSHPESRKPAEQAITASAAPQGQVPQFATIEPPASQMNFLGPQVASLPGSLEIPLKWGWVSGSFCLLGVYALGALRLWRAKRGWRILTVNGLSMLVAAGMGPAVVGFRRPIIVLPQWLLEGPAASREIALAHEQEHIAARDPALLLAALLLLVLTPWNLPLWWQLRRLKLAIEVDCDRRVLHRGVDRKQYAYTLLQINQQMTRMPMAAIAIVGRVSQVERRIAAMVAKRPANMRLWIAAWVAAAIPILVVAAEITPPTSAPAAAVLAPHAVLGIGVADFDINGAARAIAAHHTGAIVTQVQPGGAADRAGIKRGDVIRSFGNTAISGMTDLITAVAHTAPDAGVSITYLRGPAMQTPTAVTVHFSPSPPVSPEFKVIDASDWDTLRDASLPIQNPQLRAELIRISGLDQLQAALHGRAGTPGSPDTAVITPSPLPAGLSAVNVPRLKAIIAQYGWPSVSMVGVRGANAAAMIVFTSKNPAFMAEALARMEPLIRRDDVSANDYALLYDMVHTPQRFGTEIRCENGTLTPSKPIEDPAHLDERRKALGLMERPKFCRMDSRS